MQTFHLKHRRLGTIESVTTEHDANLRRLEGYRLLSDDEVAELGLEDVAGPAATAVDHVPPDHDGSAPPPRAGSGSGRGPWAEYAAANGVVVSDSASREDIVEQLAAAGVRTE